MPKAPTSQPTPPDLKPYLVVSSSRDPKSTPTPKSQVPKKAVGAKSRPWTDAEKLMLFELAVKHGASLKSFEGKIEGRTGKQCYLTWHNTLEPAIKRSLGFEAKKESR